jgi:large repetitive protein
MRRAMPLVLMRPTVVLVALIIALALVVVASALSPKPADAATKVVTKTFSNAQQITIPNNSGTAVPYPSERSVQGFNQGTVLDVNLSLKNFSHTFPDDVDVLLSKKGKTRTVMSDVGGGSAVNNITLNLDDESPNGFLPDNGPLVGGKFKPTNEEGLDFFPDPTPTPSAQSALSGFDGINPNGVWKVRVVDDFSAADGGAFAGGWSITIKARVQT